MAASLVVADILGSQAAKCYRSARDFDKADEEAVWIVAECIAAEVDTLAATALPSQPAASQQSGACSCSCGSPPLEASLKLDGKTVMVNGLPLIFDQLYNQGLKPGSGSADRLLETVRIYHLSVAVRM